VIYNFVRELHSTIHRFGNIHMELEREERSLFTVSIGHTSQFMYIREYITEDMRIYIRRENIEKKYRFDETFYLIPQRP